MTTNESFMPNEIALTAAGGWVTNADGDILWIHRLGVWDLPKGKQEKGESLMDCAVREVQEECGLKGVRIVRALCQTVHRYALGNQTMVKTTHWFSMEVDGVPPLTPQKEERISRAEWVPIEDCSFLAGSTYPTIREVHYCAVQPSL